MNKLVILATAAAIGAAVPSFANAGSVGVGASAGVDAGAGGIGAGVDAGASAGIGDIGGGAHVGADAGLGGSRDAGSAGVGVRASADQSTAPANADRARDPVTSTIDRVLGGLFGKGEEAHAAGQKVAAATGAVRDVTGQSARSADAVMEAIDRTGTTAGEIANLERVTDLSVVDIDQVASGDTLAAVANAANTRAGDIANLRAAVQANADLRARLEANGVQADEIVAARIDVNNAVTIYTAS